MKPYLLSVVSTVFLLASCSHSNQNGRNSDRLTVLGDSVVFDNDMMRLTVDEYGRCRIGLLDQGKLISFTQTQNSTLPAHHLITDGGTVAGFRTNASGIRVVDLTSSEFGTGKRIEMTGTEPKALNTV